MPQCTPIQHKKKKRVSLCENKGSYLEPRVAVTEAQISLICMHRNCKWGFSFSFWFSEPKYFPIEIQIKSVFSVGTISLRMVTSAFQVLSLSWHFSWISVWFIAWMLLDGVRTLHFSHEVGGQCTTWNFIPY
jgi:hypothetical protein